MILIDGKKIAAELREELKKEVSELKEKLAIAIKQIVESNNASFAFPSSSIYIEKK